MSKRPAIFDADDPPSKAAALDAALSLFVQDGIDATSVRDIASRSGFTNPAIFKHFDTKTEMALCLFERCYGWMARHVLAAEDSCAPTDRARILAIAATMLQLMDEDIEAVLMVQDNLRRFWRRAAPAVRAVSILGASAGWSWRYRRTIPARNPTTPCRDSSPRRSSAFWRRSRANSTSTNSMASPARARRRCGLSSSNC